MKMGIGDTAVLLVRLVDGEVGNHAPAHKLLGHKLPRKNDVFFQRKFVLQGNVKAVCELGSLAPFHLLHGVPEGGAVLVLVGGLGRKENVCADHAALVGEAVDLSVILAIQFLSGPVSGGRDNRLPCAPPDLGDMEVQQRQSVTPLLVDHAADQSGDFRQGEDSLCQLSEGRLAQAAHFRGNAFHVGPTDDKPVVSLLPLALGVAADTVLQSALPVLVLLPFGNGLVPLFLQLLS